MNQDPEVLTIIVTHNSERWIEKVLQSLQSSSVQTTIYIVDNASTDNTINLIKESGANYILTEQDNRGFAYSNNIGFKYALENQYQYVFLLNHDAWIRSNTIELLINSAVKHPEFGVVSPVHLNGKGDLLDYNFMECIAKPEDESRAFITSIIVENTYTKDIVETQFINAAAWLMPINTIKQVGYFDHVLMPHYGEDDNFVQRMAYHKLKIGFVPKSIIYHDREERKGKKLNTKFNASEAMLRFKVYGANIMNPNRQQVMADAIKHRKSEALKGLLTFNANRYRENKSLLTTFKEIQPIVNDHVKKYPSSFIPNLD